MIKSIRPDIKIVAGGNFVTRMISCWKGEAFPFSDVLDYCILYEGEESLPLLYERLFENRECDIPGLVEIVEGVTVRSKASDVSLKSSSSPAYDLIPLDKYLGPGPVLPVFSSRSCAWKCTFCSIPFASGKFRMRSAPEVAREIIELSEKFGSKYFMFVDEIMTLRSLREISRELIKLGSPIFWYAETRFSKQWNLEDSIEMYKGGCRRLDFGLESYNQRILDLMRKEVEVEYIETNLEMCMKAGISFHLFTIIGFPSETIDEVKNTIAFCERMLKRSEDTYNNPYSSWGPSEFTVDIYSEIGKSPEKFGIALIDPPKDHDLALCRDIDRLGAVNVLNAINSGMNSRVRNEAWIRKFARFHVSQHRISEEEIFLRYCLGIPPVKPPSRNSLVWLRDDISASMSLKSTVTFSALDYPAIDSGSAAVGVFYDPNTSYLVETVGIHCDIDQLRQTVSSRDFLIKLKTYFGESAHKLFQSLLHFEFCDVSIQTTQINFETVNFDFICAEHGTHTLNNGTDEVLVVSSITGMSLELDQASALIWKMISSPEGFSSLDFIEVGEILPDRGGYISSLRSMIDQGFCFAVTDCKSQKEELLR